MAALLLLLGCTMPATEPTPSETSGGETASPSAPTPPTSSPTGPAPSGFDPATKFTPLVGSTMTEPSPVRASDGRTHLAYELVLTNASAAPVTLERVDVRDAATRRPVASLLGTGLRSALSPIGGTTGDEGDADPRRATAATLPASTTWVVWLDVAVPGGQSVPSRLEHRVAGQLLRPGGNPPVPLDLSLGSVATAERPAIVLGAPVRNGIWYMSEGCCRDDTHHRRGLAPINGQLMVPQRFAIDFYLLDEQNRTWIGDPTKLTSYLSYRQPILAAAAGTVVDAEDGLPNTTSLPEPPPIPPIAQTVGNHVIVEMEPGVYALYAHMDPGSVRVRVGQRVTKGQQLGVIGSSGNSTTPHVHFQLLTTPTFFPSDSRPYVWDRFELLGRVPTRLWDDNLGLEPTGKLPLDPVTPSPRTDELPLDRDVIRFGQGG